MLESEADSRKTRILHRGPEADVKEGRQPRFIPEQHLGRATAESTSPEES